MLSSRKKQMSHGARTRAGSRMQVACIKCKERKLKCDNQVPSCANCERNGLECLVEDPVTKRHQPRNYLETLEDRITFLEGLLKQTQPDFAGSSLSSQGIDNLNCNHSARSRSNEEEDGVSDLASKVGMLGLNAAGAEPHYLGSSSAFAFSRIVKSSLCQVVSAKSNSRFGRAEESPSMLSPCLLPEYDFCITLSNAYFQNIHPQYPFLHEPTFRIWEATLIRPSEAMEPFTFDPIPLFFVNMVYAIGGLLLSNSGPIAQRLYITAQLYIDHVLSLDNLEAIQAILCCAMYSLRSPTGPSIWKLSGLALRQCIELGYHRSTKLFEQFSDPLRLEMRKRVFWCAYGIDCAVATTLGRPLGVPYQEIDAEFPMDVNDLCITDPGNCRARCCGSSDAPTTMSNALHVFRVRCLWARIHTSLYSDTRLGSSNCHSHTRTEQFRREIEDWLASAPPILPRDGDALSIFASRDWYELNYNYSILLLYRGQLTNSEGVADHVFMECLKASEGICHGYRRQYIGKSVNYTWGAVHFLFLAGLTYLHCLWTSSAVRETVRNDELSSTCTDCTIVLVMMAEKWKGASPYLEIFEALTSRTMTMMVDKDHERTVLPPPVPLSDGLDPVDLTEWMTTITNMGMPDGTSSLVMGLINDSAQSH